MCSFPENNKTFQVLDAAAKGGYSVGAYNCYNDDGVLAVISAAENCRSPAIIQLFPWTLRFQGSHFVKYVVEAAHAASVPIASETNIQKCKEMVKIANAKGIAVEAEMGRIEGGEDGLPTVDMEAILTQPSLAKAFVQETGVKFLAPAFGNIHGGYGPRGPEASWRLDLLDDIHRAIPRVPLVLHGTHGVSDELFRTIRGYGVLKINMNRTVRDDYTDFVAKNAGKLELTALKTQAVEVYTASIERVMRHVLGSAGKA
ncbi:hypothetical protein M426DRAFT_74257 [Hypoxylon sp. CI-4A]|nr:hypothetical protein M426DRAFT_74257 [Hypoxylon sp. CI-4A]